MQSRMLSIDVLIGIAGTLVLLASWNYANIASNYEERISRNLLNMGRQEYEVLTSYLNVMRNMMSNQWAYQLAASDSTLMVHFAESEQKFLSNMNYSYLRQRVEASSPLIGSLTSDTTLASSYSHALDFLLSRIDNGENTVDLLNDVHNFEGMILNEYANRLNSFHSSKKQAEKWSHLCHIIGIFLFILALILKRKEKPIQVNLDTKIQF